MCKHGIALGLAVLEWVGPDAPEQALATPEMLTGKDRRAHLLTVVWARTSDRERLDFLRQQLLQKPKQLHRFPWPLSNSMKRCCWLPSPGNSPVAPRRYLTAGRRRHRCHCRAGHRHRRAGRSLF